MSDRDVEAVFDMVHKDWNQADHPECTVSPRAGACELTPSRFEIRNPAWQQTLTEAVENSAKALGFPTKSLRAEIARLMICRPDDTVNDQQQSACSAATTITLTQTSRETGSAGFVTLMISLPSEHTGGEIAVTFKGKKKVLRTAAESKFSFSCLS